MAEPAAPERRMRARRGRVMHAVETTGDGWLRSKCRRRDRYGKTHPRAYGPAEDWTAERYWYPDCQHCPSPPDSQHAEVLAP